MAEIRVSLLGLGRAGGFHRASIAALPGVRLVQVYDTDRSRASAVAAETGCRVAEDAKLATEATDVDAVVVATPTPTHHDYVMAALDAGKPVLSEKPLGTDEAQIDGCFGLAREREVPLLVAFQRRFDPSFAAVIQEARSGRIGTLQFVRSVSRDSPIPSIDYIRTSGGIFHDCVVHDLDLVCQIAAELPVEVFCYGSNFLPAYQEAGDLDNVLIALRFASGLLGSIDVNRHGAHGYDQRIEVLGDRGMLQAENPPQTQALLTTRGGALRAPIDPSFPSRYRDAYRLEFESTLR